MARTSRLSGQPPVFEPLVVVCDGVGLGAGGLDGGATVGLGLVVVGAAGCERGAEVLVTPPPARAAACLAMFLPLPPGGWLTLDEAEAVPPLLTPGLVDGAAPDVVTAVVAVA